MTLRDILHAKGHSVYSISPDATLDEAVQALIRHRVGSLVVCRAHDPCELVGIITERDILRACSEGKFPLDEHRVADTMTRQVITGTPCDLVADTMGLMTARRIRHLPILEEGRLIGLVSIGDVVKAQHHELATENHYLKVYIQT